MFQFINEITTLPNKETWKWQNSVSVLSFLFLYTIWFLRIFSLLQILKFIYRKKYSTQNNKDYKSKRTNVPALLVELYFIIFLCFLFLFSKLYAPCYPLWYQIIAIYYLIESIVWILYYCIFRRFYEKEYSIYHPLEFFILLPIIIVSQSICVSALEHISFTSVLKAMIGISDATNTPPPLYVNILNIIYIAMVIGIIITILPSERIKSSIRIYVIGAGDVVSQRLLRALKRVLSKHQVHIFNKAGCMIDAAAFNHYSLHVENFIEISELEVMIQDATILWIATPSYAHLSILEQWMDKNIFIAVEKPITSLRSELKLLEGCMQKPQWKRVFSLNYYYLEKALPLTYIFRPYSFYEKYLSFYSSAKKENLPHLVTKLGKLRNCTIQILEKEETREWTLQEEYGGQYMETFLHAVLLSKMILGKEPYENLSWSIGDYGDKKATYFSCSGKAGDVEFLLTTGKFILPNYRKRCCELIYDNGKIYADFDQRTCTISIDDTHESHKISVTKTYNNYDIQLDMVVRCYNSAILPSSIDGSSLQLSSLQWMQQYPIEKMPHFSYNAEDNSFLDEPFDKSRL